MSTAKKMSALDALKLVAELEASRETVRGPVVLVDPPSSGVDWMTRTEKFLLLWSGSTKGLIDFARQLETELAEAKANLATASANSRRNGEAADKLSLEVRAITAERDQWQRLASTRFDEGKRLNELERREAEAERDGLREERDRLTKDNEILTLGMSITKQAAMTYGDNARGERAYADECSAKMIEAAKERDSLRAQLLAAQKDGESMIEWAARMSELYAQMSQGPTAGEDGEKFRNYASAYATTLRQAQTSFAARNPQPPSP